jgi:hypothetical protein
MVVCTGAARDAVTAREQLQQQGIGLVIKPFDIDDLLACVASLLESTLD